MDIKRQIVSQGNSSGVKTLVRAILGGLVSTSIYLLGTLAAQAQENFGSEGIQFDEDTIVEFEYVSSHGAYQSTFGVIDLDTGVKTPLIAEVKPSDTPQDINKPSDYKKNNGAGGDFEGTPGNAVPKPLAEFEFKANKKYAFYLESTYNGRPAGIFYSVDAQNSVRRKRAQFEGGLSSLSDGGTLLRWDDTGTLLVKPGREDTDFDDFIVRSGGNLACPFNARTSKASSKATL